MESYGGLNYFTSISAFITILYLILYLSLFVVIQRKTELALKSILELCALSLISLSNKHLQLMFFKMQLIMFVPFNTRINKWIIFRALSA